MADKIPPVPSIFRCEPTRPVPGLIDMDPKLYQTYAASLVSLFSDVMIQEEEKRKKFSVYRKKIFKKKENGVEKIEALVRSRLR